MSHIHHEQRANLVGELQGAVRLQHIRGRHHRQAEARLDDGAVFVGDAVTKLPLTIWFLEFYLISQAKTSMSSLQLSR